MHYEEEHKASLEDYALLQISLGAFLLAGRLSAIAKTNYGLACYSYK